MQGPNRSGLNISASTSTFEALSITEPVGKGAHIVRLIEDSPLLSSLFSAYILESGLLSRLRSG